MDINGAFSITFCQLKTGGDGFLMFFGSIPLQLDSHHFVGMKVMKVLPAWWPGLGPSLTSDEILFKICKGWFRCFQIFES